jgi:uncharacterized protein YndB with AHSA1/START domain
VSTTRIHRHIAAPRATVFAALVDGDAVGRWMVPDGMTSHVHEFDARVGGTFRISLTYDAPTGSGKSSAHTDTHHGRFVEMVPHEKLVQIVEFETHDPELQGEMTMTFTLRDAAGGTDLAAVHGQVPPGVPPEDNELGWKSSLEKLAALVEARARSSPAAD